jgi:D-glycero-D-manno-heptose 1,7-bisphosphate phosphatase
MNKCVFLDRDGVLNEERGDYSFTLEEFIIAPGVVEALMLLKMMKFITVVVTNQAGISKGLYTREQMQVCHDHLMKKAPRLIDHIYYCPYHDSITYSLCRKPETLMLEKAKAKFDIDMSRSWMVGDRERDIECGQAMGVRTIRIFSENSTDATSADHFAGSLLEAVNMYIRPAEQGIIARARR